MRQPDSNDMAAASADYDRMFSRPISEQRQDEIITMLEDCDDLEDVQELCDEGNGDDYGISAGEFNVIEDMLYKRCGWKWRKGEEFAR